ncbi:MAG: hypothetical protein HS122_07015 [Opitutaceae bacterium]|nr:hypothetical protein [Opitutaceae bacterium]
MPNLRCHQILTRAIHIACILCFGFSAGAALNGESPETGDSATRAFDVPAGDAHITLKQFAQQARLELLYSAREIEGTRTNPIKGDFTPREALNRMLNGTKLIATPGRNRGAVAVTRAPDPND